MATFYEMMCIFPGTMAETDVPAAAKSVQETIEAQGGSDVKTSDLGKSRLAYPMKHIRYGYLHLIRFSAEKSAIQSMNDKLRIKKDLLRFVIHQIDEDQVQELPTSQETIGEISRNRPAPAKKERSRKTDKPEKSEEKKETEKKEKVEKTAEKGEKDDKPKEDAVPLEQVGEKLDEILEKSISDV